MEATPAVGSVVREESTPEAGSVVRVEPTLYPGVPYAYSAVAPGAVLFTAGACPLDQDGSVVAPGDHEAQARQALANLLATLTAAGASAGDLVRTTVYVVGQHADLVRTWEVVEAGFAPYRPPSTLLGVTVLGYRDQLVEIDGIAALPPRST